MISMKYIVFGSAIIFASLLIFNAEGLKCYVCNSHENQDCLKKDPGQKHLINCDEKQGGVKYTLCRKIYQVIEFSVNGLPADTRIIRSCGNINGTYANKCYQRSGFGGRQEVCACSEDGCNGASSMKATFGVLLAAVVVFVSRV